MHSATRLPPASFFIFTQVGQQEFHYQSRKLSNSEDRLLKAQKKNRHTDTHTYTHTKFPDKIGLENVKQ